MLSFFKRLIWGPEEQPETISSSRPQLEESSRKRAVAAEPLTEIKRHKPAEASCHTSWNLDLEQADYTFSKETINIFKGTGATIVISKRVQNRQSRPPLASSISIATACGAAPFTNPFLFQSVSAPHHSRCIDSLSILRQLDNLPAFQQPLPTPPQNSESLFAKPLPPLPPPPPPLPQSGAASGSNRILHSTPLPGSCGMSRRQPGGGDQSSGAAASTVPKPPSAAAQLLPPRQTGQTDGDDDCVITSVESAPKSVAEMFAPCKYLSPDWLADIKTSSQSLKNYMQKVESEETVKMQYWAKRRESDERDLVARVTRNLKLSERELPVLPYKYEEPPPTPPPSPPPEHESEPEFPDLSPAQLDSVERAWSRQLPGSEVIAEGFSLRVTREEMRSLCGLNWLNDNIVNFYMQLIADRTGPGLPRVHAFSTFFYTKFSSAGYSAVRRWTRKVDIFDRDVLLCPVHLHNNHWTLCIIDLRSRYIIHLDSMSHGGSSGDPICLGLMRQYLADEHRDKKGSELDVAEFRLVREVGAPQQENGSDCGVFCCKFADYYCKGREFTFGQPNMPYFRKRTTVEIIEKRLLW